jgi:hypothetical protein
MGTRGLRLILGACARHAQRQRKRLKLVNATVVDPSRHDDSFGPHDGAKRNACPVSMEPDGQRAAFGHAFDLLVAQPLPTQPKDRHSCVLPFGQPLVARLRHLRYTQANAPERLPCTAAGQAHLADDHSNHLARDVRGLQPLYAQPAPPWLPHSLRERRPCAWSEPLADRLSSLG